MGRTGGRQREKKCFTVDTNRVVACMCVCVSFENGRGIARCRVLYARHAVSPVCCVTLLPVATLPGGVWARAQDAGHSSQRRQ